ncbi:metallophosphoesterase [Carboxydothermus ferrireducens]|uniref:Phosphoesterase n=1 Tax=Carboxydothermus ferrireducens DSM 11255 TaxID=1119529 RepID=A0ABX2RA51_9THEO|nr:metallophosphoesterase [Carboxydothermus ferrireducens]NYE58049.1 hypothetical protein [Carboxydothermus ferrireducens DSM 11255]
MLIGLVSDSHDNLANVQKAVEYFKEKGITTVIHAGDWVAPFAAIALKKGLGREGRLITVFGNNEGEHYYFREVVDKLGIEYYHEAGEVEIAGRKIAVYHGTSEVLTRALVECGKYDLVVTGHTHRAHITLQGKTLHVNPGELAGVLTGKGTFAVVDLESMKAELVEV